MKFKMLRPEQALHHASHLPKAPYPRLEQFRLALLQLLDQTKHDTGAEQTQNLLQDFLQAAGYGDYRIEKNGRTNMLRCSGHETAYVLLKVRHAGCHIEMPAEGDFNTRTIQQLLMCYLEEEYRNDALHHLVLTNVHEWFVFDALEFNRVFGGNALLKEAFNAWSKDLKLGYNQEYFCREIAEPIIASLVDVISYTYFNLLDFQKPLQNNTLKYEKELDAIYKLLSPGHLFKEGFAPTDPGSEENSSPVCYAGLKEMRDGFED